MHELSQHKAPGLNEYITLTAVDEGQWGASHIYHAENNGTRLLSVEFQKGTVADSGINGVSHEVLLAIVADRLRGFNSGEFTCRENALALTKIEEALHWLHARTYDRAKRGVLGYYEK